jgi:hypothetical protein
MAGQYRGRGLIDTILVHGNVVTDPPPQPIPIDWLIWDAFTERLDELRADIPVRTDRTLVIDDDWQMASNDSVIVVDAGVSFEQSERMQAEHPVVLFASGPVSLSENTLLDGRRVIRSDRMITIDDSADIAGVVLWAPRIEIKGDARFSGQAIADTLLEVSDQAQTMFPTLLWVTGTSGGLGGNPTLSLKSTKWCEGIAGVTSSSGAWGWAFGAEESGELTLDARSGWRGYLSVNGRADIRGTVAGSVNAEVFVVEDPPTTYLNWLLDARVNRAAWSGSTALPAILNASQEWRVAEYLYLPERGRSVGGEAGEL